MPQRDGSEQSVKGRGANRPKARTIAAPFTADLQRQIGTLSRELKEANERQTATAEVLRIIASSPENLQPVFDAMLERAIALCQAKFGTLFLYDGKAFSIAADRNLPPEYAQVLRGKSFSPEANAGFRRLVESKAPVHLTDMFADSSYARGEPLRVAAVELGGVRSFVGVPMLKKGELIGNFSIYRGEAGGFAENQIALVTAFADQAVIAIENARLFDEVQAKSRDLEESLQQQTATADVLKVISRSSVDLETVLDTLVQTVTRLCRADQSHMYRQRDDRYHMLAACGLTEEAKDFIVAHPLPVDRGTITGRVTAERRVIHILDVLQDPEYSYGKFQEIAGYRTMLGIPLLREDALIGVFIVTRVRVDPFTPKEIELAASFADQAVIALENARLFAELRDRQTELRVTFDNMGDGVAMFGADMRLAAWNRNFQTMLDLPDALLAKRPNYAEYVRILADRGEFDTDDIEGELNRRLQDTDRELRLERTRPDGRVIEVRRSTVPSGGFVLIYSDITKRKRAEQAVSAARDAAETALRDLQAAQDRLVQTEKLASLGQLTAGIAHEIKNPLNFVNNFSSLSAELVDELDEALAPVPLEQKLRGDVGELTQMLKSNLEKVVQHGKRADSIVKNMLAHSRESTGERRSVDINAIVEDSLNLAYHGARAEKTDFTITLRHDLDPSAGAVELYPQEITRALLNLISNGFYAATRRKIEAGDDSFEPVLSASTKDLGTTFEVRIRDNGSGIPPEVRERMFNPFFTTKPTGEGTGLGLSMTHDIIVKQHGGRIDVETEPGVFTEFIITLPRGDASGPKPE